MAPATHACLYAPLRGLGATVRLLAAHRRLWRGSAFCWGRQWRACDCPPPCERVHLLTNGKKKASGVGLTVEVGIKVGVCVVAVVGVCVAVEVAVGVAVCIAVAVAVGVCAAVDVGVDVGIDVGIDVGVALVVAVGVGVPRGVPCHSYAPMSQIAVPS